MKNLLYSLTIIFLFVACANKQPSSNQLLIKKLQSKEHLDEFDKMDLEEARQLEYISPDIFAPHCKI